MSKVKIKLSESTLDLIVKRLGSLQEQVIQIPQVEKKFLSIIIKAGREQMISQGKRSGDLYEPLKRKKNPDKLILFGKTENLFEAVSGKYLSKIDQSGNKVVGTFEVDNPYAKFHQKGTKKMPARPIFAFTDKDQQRLAQLLRDEVKKRIKSLLK